MSCKQADKHANLLSHFKEHTQQICPGCGAVLVCDDGALPFGNSLMTTWQCEVCAMQRVLVLGETGKILELTPGTGTVEMPSNMTVQNKQDLLSLTRANSQHIKSLGVRRLGIFGSFAKDLQNADSDVDLLIEFETGEKKFDNFIALAFLLENIFNRRVEMVTPESLSPYLKPHILREVEYVDLSP